MTCPQGHAATVYRVPHPLQATPVEMHRCEPCRREYTVGRDGVGRWTRRAGYCDGCDAPTWHFLTHPVHGHDILLWPKPETRFVFLLTPDGPGTTIYRDYCAACCPEFGAEPRRVIAEIDGAPITTGACVDHETPHRKYAFHFSEQYGRWLAAHLSDGYSVSDETRDALLAQWERDRTITATEDKTAALMETPHG